MKGSIILGAFLIALLLAPGASAWAPDNVSIWWPADNVYVSGDQPFKAMLQGYSVNQYKMYWQVDNGQWNEMYDDYRDYPHKEAWVNLRGWVWRGKGPYTVNFVALDWSGNKLTERSIKIYNSEAQGLATPTPTPAPTPISVSVASTPTPLPAPTPTPTPPTAQIGGVKLFVNPYSEPKKWADANRWSRPSDAALMDKIANQPEVQWFGNWNSNVWNDVNNTTNVITNSGAMPVYVIYNIPQRDCGGYSAGGSNSPDAYRSWVRTVADAIGNRKAMVLVEPDALAGMDCLSSQDQQLRADLIKDAVQMLESKGNIATYIDAGHPAWKSAQDMANRLKQAGIDKADGFALNVSNMETNDSIKNYGTQISSLVGGKHFVADTGRNGNGPNGEWCNPRGRALGTPPTVQTGNPLIDAYLWVRGPSGSDGWCNGGPSAGTFWPEYGLELSRNARW